MSPESLLQRLLARFQDEKVEYVLVGGQAVRLNGYLRATEDVDVLVKASRVNGEKIIRALSFLESSKEINPDWFTPCPDGATENVRVADDLLVDILFTANGETFDSVQQYVREVTLEGIIVRVLDIDGLLKTKTDFREKDVLDKQVLMRIKENLGKGS